MTIDAKTKIEVFAVIAAIPCVVWAIFWFAGIVAKVESAEAASVKQELKIELARENLVEIRERLIRIESKLDRRSRE